MENCIKCTLLYLVELGAILINFYLILGDEKFTSRFRRNVKKAFNYFYNVLCK